MTCKCDCVCSNDIAIPEDIVELKNMYNDVNKTKEKYWLCGDCFNNQNCFYGFVIQNLEICKEYLNIRILTENDIDVSNKKTIYT